MRTSVYDYCAGRNELDLPTQWHHALNAPFIPEHVTLGSRRTVWWACARGHIWQAVVSSRAGPQKCDHPVCAGKVRPERLERYRQTLAEME